MFPSRRIEAGLILGFFILLPIMLMVWLLQWLGCMPELPEVGPKYPEP